MPFSKGHKLSTGRPKGVPNQLASEVREVLTECITAELTQEKFQEHLENTPKEKRLDVIAKYLHFILPKLQNVTGDIDFSTMSDDQATAIIKTLMDENSAQNNK